MLPSNGAVSRVGHPDYTTEIVDDATSSGAMHRGEILTTLFDNLRIGILVVAQESCTVLDVNPFLLELLKYDASEVIGSALKALCIFPPGSHAAELASSMSREYSSYEDVVSISTNGGAPLDVRLSVYLVSVEARCFIVYAFEDVSAMHRNAKQLLRSNNALRAVRACMNAVVEASTEDRLFADVSKAVTTSSGFDAACVALGTASSAEIGLTAFGGDGAPLLEELDRADHDRRTNLSCIREALESGSIRATPEMEAPSELRASMAFPLFDNGSAFGALGVFARDCERFDIEEVELLSEIARDLSYGVSTLRARTQAASSLRMLESNVASTIEALGRLGELRDPYTAGHQRRVAQLARAIAERLALSNEQIQTIHFAALVHDIGKIYVPAEILMKPGGISAREFDLLKMHPQAGYDVLEALDFPWPVAEVVLQHHERLDGSGYPNGLRAEEILWEARVIAVADVMESMIAHRPYRAALSMDAAIAELRDNAGTKYDASVVEACLALFSSFSFT